MRILVLAGSLRRASLNLKLAGVAAEALRRAGAEPDLAGLREFEMPLYDGDLEAERGVPEGTRALAARLAAAEALVVVTPEYNHSIPGPLKNAVDWLSRLKPNPLADVPALVLSASPGLAGGSRGAWALKVPLEMSGMPVHPQIFSLPRAHEAFADDGSLRDAAHTGRLERLLGDFLGYARALRSRRSP
jgi:NAD(P)H-dependent FMN reductase